MSNVTSTFRGKTLPEAAVNETTYNVTCTLANTEYSQALNPSVKRFLIRVRGNSSLKLSYQSGQSGTLYLTIPVGCVYTEENLSFDGTLYFQTTKAAQIVEIIEWT